jgi:hypothetical protein
MAVDPLLQRNDGEPPAAGQLRSCERSRISPTGGVVLGEASQLGEFTRQPSGTAATWGDLRYFGTFADNRWDEGQRSLR